MIHMSLKSLFLFNNRQWTFSFIKVIHFLIFKFAADVAGASDFVCYMSHDCYSYSRSWFLFFERRECKYQRAKRWSKGEECLKNGSWCVLPSKLFLKVISVNSSSLLLRCSDNTSRIKEKRKKRKSERWREDQHDKINRMVLEDGEAHEYQKIFLFISLLLLGE